MRVIVGCARYADEYGQAHGAGELFVQYQYSVRHHITNYSTIVNSVTTVGLVGMDHCPVSFNKTGRLLFRPAGFHVDAYPLCMP